MAKGNKKEDFNLDDMFIGKDRMELLESSESFKTGIIPLDMILDGGLCYGDIIGLFAEKGLGKSTIYSQAIKNLIDDYGFTVYYIDVEAGTRNQIDKFGLKPYIEKGKLKISYKIQTLTQLERFFKLAFDNPDFDKTIILIDSMTQLLSENEVERDLNNQMMCSQSKDITLLFKKIRGELIEKNMILLLVAQVRSNIQTNPGFGQKTYKMAGGTSLYHVPDVLIEIKKGKQGNNTYIKASKDGKDFKVGRYINLVTDEKNKKCGNVEVTCPFINGFGIHNIYFLYNIMKDGNYLKQSGSSYKIDIINNPDSEDGVWSFKGKNEVVKFISENFEEIYEALDKDEVFVLNKLGGDVKYEF